MKYRSKIGDVEAFQVAKGPRLYPEWVGDPASGKDAQYGCMDDIYIRDGNGWHTARVGDWVVRDDHGRLSVRTDEQFRKEYEPIPMGTMQDIMDDDLMLADLVLAKTNKKDLTLQQRINRMAAGIHRKWKARLADLERRYRKLQLDIHRCADMVAPGSQPPMDRLKKGIESIWNVRREIGMQLTQANQKNRELQVEVEKLQVERVASDLALQNAEKKIKSLEFTNDGLLKENKRLLDQGQKWFDELTMLRPNIKYDGKWRTRYNDSAYWEIEGGRIYFTEASGLKYPSNHSMESAKAAIDSGEWFPYEGKKDGSTEQSSDPWMEFRKNLEQLSKAKPHRSWIEQLIRALPVL